jgi:hypothetical protein
MYCALFSSSGGTSDNGKLVWNEKMFMPFEFRYKKVLVKSTDYAQILVFSPWYKNLHKLVF